MPAERGGVEYGGAERRQVEYRVEETTPVFVISVAAQLAGMHPQTLRQYDRLGLVSPGRAAGRGRRYSARDVALLREVQRLSQEEGVNLAGIKRILELGIEVEDLREQVERMRLEIDRLRALLEERAEADRVFAAGPGGDIVAVRPGRAGLSRSGALVVWRPQPRP